MAAKAAVIVPLALCVIAAGAASLRWEPLRHAVGLAPAAEPAAQATPTPLQLSKEYVYAGGRLVATEEPSPCPAGSVFINGGCFRSKRPRAMTDSIPASLVATAASGTEVMVSWSAPSASGVDHYVVGRKRAGGITEYFTANAQSVSFDDLGVTPDSSYLYSVSAAFTDGSVSGDSNQDLATTVIFSDDPLVGSNDPHPPAATTIKATHLTELRRAVSAVHALAGLGAVTSWTYPNPVSSPPEQRRAIYKEDVQDLRDRLNEALLALGITPPAYEEITKTVTKVKAVHFQQLREAVK